MSLKEQEPALLTISEAAEFLNVSKVTIRRWTNDGKLPCSRVGSRKERRFLESDLRNLISKSQPVTNEVGGFLEQPQGTHRCVLCDESEQGWDAIVHEIVMHLANAAHVTFIGDAARQEHVVNAIEKSELDIEATIKSGGLRLLSVEESYLISGTFSGTRAAAFVESTILDAHARGFDRTLFVGWSDWLSSAHRHHIETARTEVAEYERNLDAMIQRYPHATVLCPYTLSEVAPTTLVELATSHAQIQFQSQVVYGVCSSANA